MYNQLVSNQKKKYICIAFNIILLYKTEQSEKIWQNLRKIVNNLTRKYKVNEKITSQKNKDKYGRKSVWKINKRKEEDNDNEGWQQNSHSCPPGYMRDIL